MSSVHMRQNDTLPALECTLKHNGVAYPYSTDDTVRFVMKSSAGTEMVDQTSTGTLAAMVSSTAGTVIYNWASSDTTLSGDFLADWELTTAAGKVLTFPNSGHIEIRIDPELST